MIDNQILVERKVLAALAHNTKIFYEMNDLLTPRLFRDENHKKIFLHIRSIADEGVEVNEMEVMRKTKGDLQNLFITIICNEDDYRFNVREGVLFLQEQRMKRELGDVCEITIEKIVEGEDVFNTIEYLDKGLSKISNIKHKEITDIDEHLSEAMKQLEAKMKLDGKISGIPSGFVDIDKFSGGWQPGDLVIVGGASSMGKTSLALNFARNAVMMNKTPAVIFSYEMSVVQLTNRLLSSESGVNSKWIMNGKINDEEFSNIHSCLNSLSDIPLYIDDCTESNLRYLRNKIKQYVMTKKVKLVLIDYLQLISHNIKGRTREQEVSEIARSLKNMAKEYNITVIALSQLSRGLMQRQDKRPVLSDLRESGEIEQASDIVMFVYRPEYYGITQDNMGAPTNGLAEVIFSKGRNIGIGTIPLRFQKELTRFTDYKDNPLF